MDIVSSIKNLNLKKSKDMEITHIILDIYQCDDLILSKAELIKNSVLRIFKGFDLKPEIKVFYQFEPFGVTATVFSEGVVFTIHTWPEHKSGAIDLYSFKGKKIALDIVDHLKTMFKSAEYQMKVRSR